MGSCRVEAAVRCNKHIVTEGDLPAIQNHRVVICEEVFTDLNVIAVPPHHRSALYKRFLGYKKGTDGEPEIVPSEAAIVERIFNLYLAGETVDNISKMMQAENYDIPGKTISFSKGMIMNMLSNERYCGEAPMYYVQNNHPAIIDRVTFKKVQEELARRKTKTPGSAKSSITSTGKYSRYALTDVLICGNCGTRYRRVTWSRNGTKRIVWRCVSRLEFGTKYCQHSPTLDEGKLHSAILAAMNEYAAIRQEVCPDVLAMAEEARQALSQAGARLLQLKKRMDAVSREQSDVLDRLLVNMADTELNARMKALTDEKESLKAQIADAQQAEVDLEEQDARRRQMWDSIMECAAGYTEFDNELVRQVIQKITVEDAETIHIHFRDSDVVLEQEVE